VDSTGALLLQPEGTLPALFTHWSVLRRQSAHSTRNARGGTRRRRRAIGRRRHTPAGTSPERQASARRVPAPHASSSGHAVMKRGRPPWLPWDHRTFRCRPRAPSRGAARSPPANLRRAQHGNHHRVRHVHDPQCRRGAGQCTTHLAGRLVTCPAVPDRTETSTGRRRSTRPREASRQRAERRGSDRSQRQGRPVARRLGHFPSRSRSRSRPVRRRTVVTAATGSAVMAAALRGAPQQAEASAAGAACRVPAAPQGPPARQRPMSRAWAVVRTRPDAGGRRRSPPPEPPAPTAGRSSARRRPGRRRSAAGTTEGPSHAMQEGPSVERAPISSAGRSARRRTRRAGHRC
jgi:hypothetical protein